MWARYQNCIALRLSTSQKAAFEVSVCYFGQLGRLGGSGQVRFVVSTEVVDTGDRTRVELVNT